MYLLLFDRGAHDWVDGTRIGYDKSGSAPVQGFKPQYHHIFPRSLLRKLGRSDDDINVLANITVLNETTNCAQLGSKPPARYIREFCISRAFLQEHLIPEEFAAAGDNPERCEKVWSTERYDDFIVQRAELLAAEANKFLERLKGVTSGS